MSRQLPTAAQDRIVFDYQPARESGPIDAPDGDGVWRDSRSGRQVVTDPDFDLGVLLDARQSTLEIAFADAMQPRTAFTLTAWVRWGAPGPAWPQQPQDPEPRTDEACVSIRLGQPGADLRIGDDEHFSVLDLTTLSGQAAGTNTAPAQRDSGTSPWRHLTLRWDGDAQSVDFRIDGETVEVDRVSDAPPAAQVLPFRRSAHVVLGADPGAQRELRIGPVRLHNRLRSDSELRFERHFDHKEYPSLDAQHPLAFRVADALDEPNLYITDDDVAGRMLHIVIENRSRFGFDLPIWNDEHDQGRHINVEDSARHPWRDYLELRFRPGCLTGGARHWVEAHSPGWRVGSRAHPDGGVSLFLARTARLHLDPGQTSAITLHHVRASGDLGAHGTHLELLYPHPHHTGQHCSRISVARVVGQRGRRRSPLRFGAVGDRTVLNDGKPNTAENPLRLYIANTSRTHPVHLQASVGGVGSTLVLSFDAGGADDDWALATVDQLLATEVKVRWPDGSDAGWNIDVETLGEAPEWILSPTRDITLAHRTGRTPVDGDDPDRDRLILEITNLETDLPSGRARAYLRLENVLGFWDDDRIVDLEKSRVQRDESGLHVHGNLTYTGKLFDSFGELIPPGVIMMWAGSAKEIPEGWVLCNGANNTPDLSDRFVLSANPTKHAIVGGMDSLGIKAYNDEANTQTFLRIGGAYFSARLAETRVSNAENFVRDVPTETIQYISSISAIEHASSFDNRPLFYELCFIMKRYQDEDPISTLPPKPDTIPTA